MLRGRYYFLLISFEVVTHQRHTNSLLPPEITAEVEKYVWIIIIPMRYDKLFLLVLSWIQTLL